MKLPYLALIALIATAAPQDWPTYGADAGGTRYSALKQITRENVSKLQIAWTHHTGALQPETKLNEKAAFEATPILFEGALYLSTPFNQIMALDPATGAEKWTFDPQVDRSHSYSEVSSRGVAAWTDAKAAAQAPCKLRIFEGTIDARLLSLDAKTGKPCADFGKNGQVELWHNVGYGPEFRGDYQVTSAPTVVGDLVITGSSIGDNGAVDMPRGVVRAYDARTGALRWTWDPIPWAEKQQVRTGAANAWSTFAADPARDLVFIPTGSASPDYYGGARPGDNKWANSVVALKASTGAFVWGFQVAHHDLWDFDVASQPALIEFHGRPAVAVTTKIGNLFVLDRITGQPLHTVEERAVPKSDIPGEDASPSQPMPAWSAMVPQKLTAADAWGPTPEARKWCQDKIESLRNEGLFTPPTYGGTISFPGNIGGVNWGGAAWDPRHPQPSTFAEPWRSMRASVDWVQRLRLEYRSSEPRALPPCAEAGRSNGRAQTGCRSWWLRRRRDVRETRSARAVRQRRNPRDRDAPPGSPRRTRPWKLSALPPSWPIYCRRGAHRHNNRDWRCRWE